MSFELQKAKLPEDGWTTKKVKHEDYTVKAYDNCIAIGRSFGPLDSLVEKLNSEEDGWQGKVEVYGPTIDPSHTLLVGGPLNGKYVDLTAHANERIVQVEQYFYETGERAGNKARFYCGTITNDSITISTRVL